MLKSMTACGRASKKSSLGIFCIEIHSVNRKHLEINVNTPAQFSRFEALIRKQVAAQVFRGAVTVKFTAVPADKLPIAIIPNLPLLKQYKAAWEILAKELSLPCDAQSFFSFMKLEQNLFYEEERTDCDNEYLQVIEEVLSQALQSFVQMKKDEGAVLVKDILERWNKLRTAVHMIAAKAPEAVQRFRHKLLEKIQDVVSGSVENDERVLKEIAIYAEKIDISEEITRFKSHLQQFYDYLHSPAEGLGKTLEFILQELHREINTIASKASDIDISRFSIECKSEIEKIREQIQNIE